MNTFKEAPNIMRKRTHVLCLVIFSALAAVAAEAIKDDTFAKTVSALPPEQQVVTVITKLKELNPSFDGKETHKIESGAVTALSFSTVSVTDISPVKALRWLRTLTMTPPTLNQKGSLESLAALQGMQLTWLWCHNNPISDLSPLKGMPLTVLSISGTQVSDISPLSGMKLQVLSFNDTVISDLAPLEGMPLTVLWCNNTKVADLSPLKAMPLREIKCDFVAERDAAILRSIRTLAKINDLLAKAFWARVGPVTGVNVVEALTPQSSTTAQSRGTAGVRKLPSGTEKTMTSSRGIELVWIPSSEFMIGSSATERDWAMGPGGSTLKAIVTEGEAPRSVKITNGFWLARTELTLGQWRSFVEATRYVTDAEKTGEARVPDLGSGGMKKVKGANWRDPKFGIAMKDNHPVCCVTWNDAVAFCDWLTETEKRTGKLPAGMVYRLPTESEWECACRGGRAGTKFWWGDSSEDGDGRLNWAGNKTGFPAIAPVDHYRTKGRNRYGLADMLGNIWELCLDRYDATGAQEELAKGDSSLSVVRGGSFRNKPGDCRCAHRRAETLAVANASVGFRVCCGISR